MRPTPDTHEGTRVLFQISLGGGSPGLGLTRSVEVDVRLAAEVIVETLAAVLLQLDLFDPDCLLDHLVLLLSSEEAVQQRAVHRDGPPLLSDLVSGLRIQKMKMGKFGGDSK